MPRGQTTPILGELPPSWKLSLKELRSLEVEGSCDSPKGPASPGTVSQGSSRNRSIFIKLLHPSYSLVGFARGDKRATGRGGGPKKGDPLRDDNPRRPFRRAKFYRWPPIVVHCAYLPRHLLLPQNRETIRKARPRGLRRGKIAGPGISCRRWCPWTPSLRARPAPGVIKFSFISLKQSPSRPGLSRLKRSTCCASWWPPFVARDRVYEPTDRRSAAGPGETMLPNDTVVSTFWRRWSNAEARLESAR